MIKDQQNFKSFSKWSSAVKDLVESSKNLPTGSSDIGSIELGSKELKKRIHDLRTSKSEKEANFTKAHYLLAGSGIVIEDLESEIKSVELQNSLENSIVPSHNGVDFDSHLNNKKEENILAAIEQSLTTASRDFDIFINQNITMDWRKRKQEIYESFGFGSKYLKSSKGEKTKASSLPKMFSVSSSSSSANVESENSTSQFANWGKSTIGHSVLGPRLGGGDFSDLPKDTKLTNVNSISMREKFEKFAVIIYELNNSRQQLKPVHIINNFYDATKDATDSRTRQINECWKILNGLIDKSEPQNSYFDQYNDFKSKNSANLRGKIIKNSIKYLESQFLKHVDVIYRKRVNSDDNSGASTDEMENGLPIHLNKIKYYVKSQKKRLFEKEEIKRSLLMVNDVPIWALIFYLIRAGCYTEALEVAEESASIFKKIDSNFVTYLKSFIVSTKDENSLGNHSLSTSLQNSIQQEFNTNIKNNDLVDPYRYAVYKIIGKCDLSKKSIPKIFASTEDWLWTNFMLINERNQDYLELSKYESYTLFDFQKNLIQYGAAYFNGSSNFPTYIHVLLLGGLFELAVKYAFSIGELEAVHLAIGLAYYGLLRMSDYDSIIKKNGNNANELTATNENGLYEINYARLIGYYTRSFRVSDTIVALEYLLLINLAGNNKYYKLSLEAIRELVIETKEFSILLGTINKDGTRYPGRIENRQQLLYVENEKDEKSGTINKSDKSSYLYEIIEQAAKRIGEEGRVYDSLLLYQLSENHDQVIKIINRLLGDLLSSTDIFQPISKETNEQECSPIEIGEKLLKTYELSPSSLEISSSSREILKKLLDIAKIKETFVSGNYETTLGLIKELDLIPISTKENLTSIRMKCQEINQQQLDYNLMKNVGNLLLIAMNCINQLISKSDQSQFFNNVRLAQVNELEEIAKQIMVFAGMIQYKMPKEVYIKLTSLELVYK
ncbi:linker nucleoporin [Saccharomycopsis crataegensis]|uniref:Nuclear pore protein n=1 Tax=Saccharomycopsis crataegensis TaxID=43959 RepID=A0AAV5QF58_9ASCO|nr:linker nucleoporin [Saccharomycopsis crataegensis]